MDVLKQTPGSVLWLAQDSLRARQNLEAAAHAHGVDSGRLHFAPRLSLVSQHLARYAVADLALDTFPYTSHTTGSDALWAGCLMVGLCGDTFAARVSGSLLSACGLNDLITYSTDQYRNMALRLANDQPFRREMRERLLSAYIAAPLFDSLTFTRDLENLYCGALSQPLRRQ
jgi:predicted O-linked N-acetylglucosamine transferase (SPINDLY family)